MSTHPALVATTHATAETEQFARRLAAVLAPGDAIALCGDLGAGKTCFVRGLARGLGVPSSIPVTSPTFTLVNVYDAAEVQLVHVDLYRVADASELDAMGYRDLFAADAIVVVEWADRFAGALPPHTLWISIADAPTRQAARDPAIEICRHLTLRVPPSWSAARHDALRRVVAAFAAR